MENQESKPVIETAIEEAAKMNIPQLRKIADDLAKDQNKLAEFKENPTEYLKTHVSYVPKGFHAHYAEGESFVPMEVIGKPTERFAFAIPIGKGGLLSTCVFCFDDCCGQ